MLLILPPDLTFVLNFMTVTSFLAQLFELSFMKQVDSPGWLARAVAPRGG